MVRGRLSVFNIVVGIIVVIFLLLVGLVFFEDVQTKFYDNQRVFNIKEFAKALAIYQTSKNRYPLYPNGIEINGDDPFSRELIGELLFNRIPLDPKYPEFLYVYQSDRTGSTYGIRFCLETDKIEGYQKGCNNVFRP